MAELSLFKTSIKVLVVDDSAIVRHSMRTILSADKKINVIGVASDPYIAANMMKLEAPDVIVLDVEMPRMDGITFLKKIMTQHPIPVVICSSQTPKGSNNALKALEYGAVEIIEKPKLGTKQFIEESQVLICDAVKAAHCTALKQVEQDFQLDIQPKLTADAIIAKPKSALHIETTEKIVVVGASTGGTEALRSFLEGLPLDAPGVVIVQHMPEHFTKAFAGRLDSSCKVSVKEAEQNDTVIRGRALIAPGNHHILLKRSGARYYVEIKDGPLVSRHRPSVDVLFRSAARYAGKNAVGVIMTGMGDDGAKGMREMKDAGAHTIAQDEKSCVVFGMPREAIKLDAVDKVVPLVQIAGLVIKTCGV
ncbi:MAG: chemotaxis response regulator protein-glutamate methylesterase [Spirochaetales bacterium]|nr:chemotaxis response regulator protein-glutamate methylesterase [Spirochaetales bacterium]